MRVLKILSGLHDCVANITITVGLPDIVVGVLCT